MSSGPASASARNLSTKSSNRHVSANSSTSRKSGSNSAHTAPQNRRPRPRGTKSDGGFGGRDFGAPDDSAINHPKPRSFEHACPPVDAMSHRAPSTRFGGRRHPHPCLTSGKQQLNVHRWFFATTHRAPSTRSGVRPHPLDPL